MVSPVQNSIQKEKLPIETTQQIPLILGGKAPRFDGPDYSQEHDQKRLTGQLLRIFNLMKDGNWRTLSEITEATGDPQASISAQIRHLRKPRFGSHTVYKRHKGEPCNGLWEYRVVVNYGVFNDQQRSSKKTR